MTSKTNRKFWKCFDALPPKIQRLAREKFVLWKKSPHHPSLQFEERRGGVCVVRVGDHYRALALKEGELVVWFWIGTHEDYNGFKF